MQDAAKLDTHPSPYAVDVPSVEIVRGSGFGLHAHDACVEFVERRARRNVPFKLFIESQLIIVHLRGLEQATDLHRTLSLFFFGLGSGCFALLGK